MNPRFRIVLLVVLIVFTVAGIGWTQPPLEKKQSPVPAEVPKKQEKAEEPKDPTNPSPKLKELLQPDKSGKYAAPVAGAGPRMPLLALRGRVVSSTGSAVALLEVEGKLYSIAKGSSLSGGGNTILRIVDITSGEVRIEVHPLNEVVILR